MDEFPTLDLDLSTDDLDLSTDPVEPGDELRTRDGLVDITHN